MIIGWTAHNHAHRGDVFMIMNVYPGPPITMIMIMGHARSVQSFSRRPGALTVSSTVDCLSSYRVRREMPT